MSPAASPFPGLIETLLAGADASPDELCCAFELALDGQAPLGALAGLLVALRTRRPSAELLAQLAGAVRRRAGVLTVPAALRRAAIDTCGTGGDGARTFNVSTAAALTAAACGAIVAKHGNRAVSSRSGSADALEALGLAIDAEPSASCARLAEARFAFFLAPRVHACLRAVAAARGELGVRTVFNLVGPLVNPLAVERQLIGVYDPALTGVVARAALALGGKRVLVVHCGGLDELGLHAPTRGHLAEDGEVREACFEPRAFGLPAHGPERFAVADADASAARLREIFAGRDEPGACLVALNAGAALFVAGRAASVEEGCALAQEALARGTVERFVASLRVATSAAEALP